MTSSIELNFFHISSKAISRFKLGFQESIQEIIDDEYRYNLPDELFKFNKDKAILTLKLFFSKIEYEFLFDVYKGENIVYIQLDYLFKTVFELIIYSNKTYFISIRKKKLEKFDSLGNKYRKRLTLINTDNTIVINDKSINLLKIVYNNYGNDQSPTDFYQISAFFGNEISLDQSQFIIKKINKINEEVNLEIFGKKERLSDFLSEMEIAIKKENFFTSVHNFKTKYNDIFQIELPKLNKDSDYINYLFQIKNIIDLEPFYINYLVNKIFKNEKILNNQQLLLLVTERIKQDFKNICSKDNIKSDEKIRIMSIYFSLYSDCEDISYFNSLKIKNFIFSERQENSVLDKVYKFYFKFIELLTEDSKIFFYLLQLVSGIGFFHEKKAYTFDLTNINMVKKYLKSLFPQSLTIYNFYQAKDHFYPAFCEANTSGFALNEIFLLPKNKYNIEIDYNSSNNKNIREDEYDDIATNIILCIFHEYMSHKKSPNKERTDSPKIKDMNNNKLINLFSGINKGDSGPFSEICFNKYYFKTILKLLLSLYNKGKLIHRPDLFAKYDEILKKYVILKTIAKEKEIIFKFDKNLSIEDEINLMCQKIDYEKYIKNQNDINENKNRIAKNFSDKFAKQLDERNELSIENKIEINFDSDEQGSEEDENDEEEEDEEVEKEKEKNEGYRRFKRILKKFHLKNDEELSFNVEKIMNQPDLSEEDQKDLDYLYSILSKIY